MKPLTIVVVVVLVVVVVGGIVVRFIGDGDDTAGTSATILAKPTEIPKLPLNISVLAALPVEPWASSAAEVFNAEERSVGGRKIVVEVIPMDGLTARDKWAAGAFNPFPTAWLAESRAWVRTRPPRPRR